MFTGGRLVKLNKKYFLKPQLQNNSRCFSNKSNENEVSSSIKDELAQNRAIAKESFESVAQPVTPEQLFKPVADSLVKGYNEVYDVFSKPIERDFLPPRYYELQTEGERSAFLAHFKAYEQARTAVASKYGFSVSPAQFRLNAVKVRENAKMNDKPIRVCITGASGQLGYALCFRVACGSLFGPNQPVVLHLLELPGAMQALEGVAMELKDCAFPTLQGIVATSQAERAFDGVDYALLVGAMPRGPGMERGDLLTKNAEIFSAQGKALNSHAKGVQTRVIVVGNPANTNALIAAHNAPNIPAKNFSALTRLDHNRALSQLAAKVNCSVSEIQRFVLWGNHSATMVPDITHAYIKGQLATDVITDKEWLQKTFVPAVQKRGAAIIAARGVSSAASAANAVVDAAASWHFGTQGRWTSAAIVSTGQYGVTKGLFYSYPVVYNENGEWDVVRNLPIDEATAAAMEATHKELLEERDGVSHLLK